MKKIILVTGATGAQGGSVANALLSQNNYAVRCLTRDATSAKATALQTAGAEICQGNLDDIETLKTAMEGCYGVFGLTNFWEHFDKEYAQGINLIDAAESAGIQHFVLHSLPGYSELSKGKYSVPHCDIKAALQNYTVSKNIPSSFVHMAFYYENFLSYFPLQNNGEDQFSFGFPQGDTRLAMASVEDIGPVVAAAFNEPAKYIGKTLGVVGEDETCDVYAATMQKVLGVPVQYQYIPRDVFASFPFPGAEELANMFEVQRLHILNRGIHLKESYQLNPAMQSFEKWLMANKGSFFLQLNKTAETVAAI
jgi:uncharacterized protein YbjT (DUF2867 family)